jgi:hypothetical protein
MLRTLWQKWACFAGAHSGGNYCAYCGKQLLNYTIYPYRVYSLDGRVNLTVYAINAHHAKQKCQEGYCQGDLIVERLPALGSLDR